jgi:Eukaryotic membrane protein family
VNQNLTKRLGLPVTPLSCLFIRSSVQTYHTFLATHLPTPMPSTATELALESEATASPATTAALEHFDAIIRRALGRSTFGSGVDAVSKSWYMIGTDDIIAFITMLIFFLCAFLVLLACKLVLGMLLLSYARNRYSGMKQREHLSLDTKGKRLGGWGMVEVDEDKRRWIYEDDPEGAKALKERERKAAGKARDNEKGSDFARVTRYEMAAKRIW